MARSTRPEHCSATGVLGKHKKHVKGSGEYTVCLNERQKRSLFGNAPLEPRIACGTFACVWPAPRGRVVKITRDRMDVDALMKSQGNPHVVKVHRAVELAGAGRDRRTGRPISIFAIEAERLAPMPDEKMRALARPLEASRQTLVKLTRTGRKDVATSPRAQREIPPRACAKIGPKARGGCERFIREYVVTFGELARRGVIWFDSHIKNIGLDAKGTWKALDLGYKGTQGHVAIPTLTGP